MERKLLSIVVPTKNRYYYLKYLIRLVENLHSEEVELVIQDNSDDNSEFVEYLEKNSFPFMRYSYIQGQIPMSLNTDKAIMNSTGEYICFLGDDDGFTKYIINGVHWMKENGVEAVKPAEPLYSWPDAPQGRSADILYYPFSGRVKFVSAYDELLKVLHSGILHRGRMPIAYHAVVSREVLDKVYKVAGTYFPGNSPDISNAVALSLVVKKFALVDIPWAYSGNSAYKGGGVFAQKNPAPKITEIGWFRPNPEKNWYYKVPKIASGSNIWADSAISSLIRMQREDLLNEVNFNELYANFIFDMPQHKSLVFDVCESRIRISIYSFYVKMRRFSLAVFRRLGWILHLLPKKKIVKKIENTIQASSKLEELSDGEMIFY